MDTFNDSEHKLNSDCPTSVESVVRGNLDFDDFMEKAKELLGKAWGDWGTFTEEEPTGNDPAEIQMPVITFDTHERIRSKSHTSLDPILFKKIREIDHYIYLYRMWFDVEVEFKIYHNTNRDARILMKDFEEFLFAYKPHFKNEGVSEIIFLAETKPQVVTKWGQELPQRTLRYLVRIERITEVRSNILQDLNINVDNQPTQNEASTLIQEYNNLNAVTKRI